MINRPIGSRAANKVILKIYRDRIGSLEVEQDRLFKAACKQLKIKPDSTQGIYLFDFLYNGLSSLYNVKSIAQLEKVLWPAKDAAKIRGE